MTISNGDDVAMHSKLDRAILWLVAGCGVIALLLLLLAPIFLLPAEDAVILFQYSRNLAHTGAITYNAFSAPAEGATDFAWMVLIAGGFKAHISPMWVVALVNVASLIAIPFLLFRIAKRKGSLLAAFFIMGVFALLPQMTAALLGFSTLPFSVLLLIMVLCFTERRSAVMPLVCLILCLFRPDGVVFAVPLLIAALVLNPERFRQLLYDFGFFVLPGALYFVWRWHYFGALLPLPFQVKSDTTRIAHLFSQQAIMDGALLILFCSLVLWFTLRKTGAVRGPVLALLLCVIVLPSIFYLAMRLDQDVGHRFFIYLPIGFAVVCAAAWNDVAARQQLILRTAAVLWFVLLGRIYLNAVATIEPTQFDNRREIAEGLSRLGHGVIIPTEAGFLPYYSGWETYDPWGLNTPQFARHLIQPADVQALRPDVIEAHVGGSLECIRQSDWQTPYLQRSWDGMTRNLVAGANPSSYELWYVPYGNIRRRERRQIPNWQGDQECWLIRDDSPFRAGIEGLLRQHKGETAEEYAAHQPHDVTKPGTTPDTQREGRVKRILMAPYRLWYDLSW